ncbi:MAG TPA: GYD domain-containing protein [Actinomycetota bacterium]|nr:GYD domain-containing protein [Actinomycetota bacterium]
MPRYLWRGSYTTQGIRGLLAEGGTSRRETIERLTVDELGGIVEAFYFAFGDRDVVVIAEVPDPTTAAAITMAIRASGAVDVETTVLLTPEEMDVAAEKATAVSYRPPGG